jgi:hypothetical protein
LVAQTDTTRPVTESDLVAAVTALRISSPEEASRAGYHRIAPAASGPDLNAFAGEHWINPTYLRQTRIDPARPAFLLFYPLGGRHVLVGVAYAMMQEVGASQPTFAGGGVEAWHVHLPCGQIAELRQVLAESREDCLALGGQPSQLQMAMMHFWLVPNPGGPFASDNPSLPFMAVDLRSPAAADMADPVAAGRVRRLGLALSETFGAAPRLGILISQHPDSSFARWVGPYRAAVAEQLAQLRRAELMGDREGYLRAAELAIARWSRIRAAYSEAAINEVHRRLMERWYDNAIEPAHGDHHAQVTNRPAVRNR